MLFLFRLQTWNECLCRRDSDGDGLTNGEELGDPNCVWEAGKIPDEKSASHPGRILCRQFTNSACLTVCTYCTRARVYGVYAYIAFTGDILYPAGICEPLDDPLCMTKNDWDLCAAVEFECQPLETTPGNLSYHACLLYLSYHAYCISATMPIVSQLPCLLYLILCRLLLLRFLFVFPVFFPSCYPGTRLDVSYTTEL